MRGLWVSLRAPCGVHQLDHPLTVAHPPRRVHTPPSGWSRGRWQDDLVALTRSQQREAADLLRSLLAAVQQRELTVDGPAAAAVLRRLEGALIALESLGKAPTERDV